MERLRIDHHTEFCYRSPVTFGLHRAMLRPREGHDVHIEKLALNVEPSANVRWLRDIYGNSIAVIKFLNPSDRLVISSSAEVSHFEEELFDFEVEPTCLEYPFQYNTEEQAELVPYRLCSYPHDGFAVREWLRGIYLPGQTAGTLELLDRLNTRIFETFQYENRDAPGVQIPCETLAAGKGSCRDFAVLMMEAARHWGFGARFVSGYVQLLEGQHGSTHAWTEIYIPGFGWRGFDPTNNKPAGTEHVSVAVARDQDKAMPLAGTWEGPADAFERMEVSVQVIRSA
jgi:transglutaminase-like putative cysteine protease